MRAVLILAVSAAALPGLARGQDDPACAKFEEPLAYNACLASHGPPAKATGSPPGSASGRRLDPEGEAPAEARRARRGSARVARPHGRIHTEFRIR